MSRRWKTRCRPLFDNEILRKTRLHENELCKGEFGTSNPSKIIMSSLYSIIAVTTRFFPLEITWKKQGKQRETSCFHSKVTNCVSSKTRAKTKHQTSRGQNSYSSSFTFTDLKPSNLKDADSGILTMDLHSMFVLPWSPGSPNFFFRGEPGATLFVAWSPDIILL